MLDMSDMKLIQFFALKVQDGLTDRTFQKIRYITSTESLKNTQKRIQFLSGFQPVRYDCCRSSCVCYTGPYEALKQCPKCNSDRYKSDGTTPYSYLEYLPIIPRLRAMLGNFSYARKMQYRSNHKHDPRKMTDIFDGTHYQLLQKTFVTIGDEELPEWFFSDPRDIALGLSTDGFGPFKRRTKTAWPIIMFNYNLPPEERFLKDNIIRLGTIPGPKKPDDADSFFWPVVQELLQLKIGVSAFDGISKEIFLLHAHLIVVFGDIPAMSMLMRMKGHNAIYPCRMCTIRGVRIPFSRKTTHYVPLRRNGFPDLQQQYHASTLPLRDHATFLRQAKKVQYASNTAESERLATKYGVKGIPLLSTLSSLSFPVSFPYDFMHLIWSNLIPNLISLWTGNYKDLSHDGAGYVLAPTVWEAIGQATAKAGDTIPAAFGSRVPNIASEKAQMIAETYSIWTLYIAPTLLKGRFTSPQYYTHFIKLVRLLNLCLQFEITQDQVDELERGFNSWVEKYEEQVF
jgi:hypothetical protein